MEGLILAIIIAVIGSLFNGKNKKKEEQSMPPFNNQPIEKPTQSTIQREQQSQPKTLEDFAKGIFEQLNEQNPYSDVKGEQQNIETTKDQPMIEKENHSKEKRKPLSVNRSAQLRQEKLASKTPSNDVIKENEIGQLLPNSRQALVQAIIASEIIGPPKAKQRS